MNYVMRKIALMIALVFSAGIGFSHEGMWLVHLLNRMNEAEMKNLGLNLSAEEIYSINQACLKDAIVRLNGGMCTGEVISDKGLVLTNHHCGYDAIQSLSSVENDILTNGWMAKSMAEEKPMDGFVISFLVRVEDLTKEILQSVTAGMSESERAAAIELAKQTATQRLSESGKYDVDVKSFFYGNEFYAMIYTTFRDIRLVGNPPESIGKYGGDTDNWMWPRHTGDFSMMRIYSDKDGNPADYSQDNVPLKPKHFLPVSLDGVEDGDFSMIMGFPGSTDRYLSSWGVKQSLELQNPATIAIRDLKLRKMKEHMDADPAVRLKYAAKYAQVANYWKYFIGQNKGLIRLNVEGKKKKLEEQFTRWVNEKSDRKSTYGNALNLIEEYYTATNPTAKSNVYAVEAGLIGPDITLFAWRFNRTYEAAMKETDAAKQKEILASFKEQAEAFYKDYDMPTEKDMFIALSEMYYKDIAVDQQPSWMRTIDTKYKGNVKMFVEKLFATSFMVDKNKLFAFIDKPSKKVFEKDMAIMVAKSTIDMYRMTFSNPAQEKFDEGYRLFVAGLREMQPDKKFYPDANSTMRLTYGQVGDYIPADAVQYDFYTTAGGILEKKDNANPEFVVPDKLDELITKRDFGQYVNSKGELPVCFISNNDITGGNSGSPVIDGNGNLIGLAFDGNWEAMSGDIAFEAELQRTISVDIRYVLFIIDKYMGAGNIVNELKLVKGMKKPKPVVSTVPATSVNTQVDPNQRPTAEPVRPVTRPETVPARPKDAPRPAEKK